MAAGGPTAAQNPAIRSLTYHRIGSILDIADVDLDVVVDEKPQGQTPGVR